MIVEVKICGITRPEDAKLASEAGAVSLGFIFAKGSTRHISPEDARAIIRTLPAHVIPVGVFVDSSREDILRTIDLTGIRCVQLHGDEPPEALDGLPVPGWKAFRVGEGFDCAILAQYKPAAYLLDTRVDGAYGGTGRTFDWEIARKAREYGQIVLSGGIGPANIREAISIVRPFAVDVNSGVESSPGKKDGDLLARLFEEVRAAGEMGQ